MLYMTTGEILKSAQHLSNTHNLTFEDFSVSINYINSVYREIYSMICDERDDYNISTLYSSDAKFELPDDLLIIKSVGIRYTSGIIKTVEKTADNQLLSGCYAIENNTFCYFGELGGNTLVIKYCRTPKTITFPSPNIKTEIPLDATNIVYNDDEYIYYTDNAGTKFKYEINTTLTEIVDDYELEPTEFEWHGDVYRTEEDLDNAGLIVYCNDEVTDVFDRYDRNDNILDIKSIFFSNNYCMISYSDGKIYIHDGIGLYNWNIKEQTGRITKGLILGLNTNDTTGYGCLYNDNKHIYISSYLTDTVLDYPTNSLFQYLIYKMAIMYSNLNGMENTWLEKECERCRLLMFKELKRNRGSISRIRNTIRYKGI